MLESIKQIESTSVSKTQEARISESNQPVTENRIGGIARKKQPPQRKRSIGDVETALPLPTTFKEGETFKTFQTRPSKVGEPLPLSESQYPYKYYEITLRRGVIGLPKATRNVVASLGLTKRHQVVWKAVGPTTAGEILRVKELVTVRLVNEIPAVPQRPSGYTKVGNLLDQ